MTGTLRAILGLTYILATFVAVYFLNMSQLESSFKDQFKYWEHDLSSMLMEKDWLRASYHLRPLFKEPLAGVALEIDGNTIVSWPIDFRLSTCSVVWSHPVVRYGITLGVGRACPSLSLLAWETLKSGSLLALWILAILIFTFFSKRMTIIQLQRTRAIQEALAAKRLNLFAAKVAHDIRSPLSALTIAVKSDCTKPEVQGLLCQAVDRIQEISEDMLARSKDHSDLALRKEFDVLSEWVNPVIEEKRFEFAGRTIELKAASKPIFLNADLAGLRRSFSNLLNNALEASPPNTVVEVRVEPLAQHVNIKILDFGKGIPPNVRQKIGELGFTYAKGERGNGLGVYFARETLERERGTLSFADRSQGGTEVCIRLPI
jgi:signal transduction histidine kinase